MNSPDPRHASVLRRIPIRRRFFLLTGINAAMVALLFILFWRYDAAQDSVQEKQTRMQQLDLTLRTIQSDSNRLQALIRQYIERPEVTAQETAARLGKTLFESVGETAAANPELRAPLQNAQAAVRVLVASFDRLVTLNTQIMTSFDIGILSTAREASALFAKAGESLPAQQKTLAAKAYEAFVDATLDLSAFYFRPETAGADKARDGLEHTQKALHAIAKSASAGTQRDTLTALADRMQTLDTSLMRLESLMLERSGLMRVDVGVSAERLTSLSDKLLAENQQRHTQLRQQYLAEQQGVITTLIVLTALVVVLGALMSWYVARSVQQPLVELMDSVDAFAAGNLAREVPGCDQPDEIGTLARTLQTLKTGALARHEAESALRLSEERYRNVVDNVPEAIIIAQVDRLIFANPRACELTGYALHDLLPQPFLGLLHPDDVEMVAERHRRRMQGEAVERYTQFRIRRADGEHIWVESSAQAVVWDGKPATLAFLGDLTDRRRAEESVRAALDQQKELNELRSRFIAMASHEFRTPLATILSSAELLRDYGDKLPADEKRDIVRGIENGVQRMASLLNDVLTVGRVESGKIEFQPANLSLKAFCQSVVAEVMRSESRQGRGDRNIKLHIADDAAAVLDEQLMRHVLGNLLSNAVKYSPPQGEVRFTVTVIPNTVEFSVADGGIGIPGEDMPHLFDTFHRGRNARNVPGTGLGLAIAKKAVEIHGGTIDVDSVLGKGTRVTVTLPAGGNSIG
jgi:PAS domain S-box-containing protein